MLLLFAGMPLPQILQAAPHDTALPGC